MQVFRLHLRPKGGAAGLEETFDYCLAHGVLGVGWRTRSNKNTHRWDEYFREASEIYDDLSVCEYIYRQVGRDDLIWTRDPKGEYYLAKVISEWEYWMAPEALEKDIDIANIVRVDIQRIPIDYVPGKVIATFRARRTIQKIANAVAVEYSKYLWNQFAGEDYYAISDVEEADVFMLLDDEETEDLVFLYLQTLGWYVVPNSRKADTMSFEYLAIHPQTQEKAMAQVKTGNEKLNRQDYSQYPYRVFLFQSNGLYEGEEADNVYRIAREELLEFLKECADWLPGVFKTKLGMVAGLAGCST